MHLRSCRQLERCSTDFEGLLIHKLHTGNAFASCRAHLIGQGMALVCELGIVACTLVKLYNLRHPGNAAGEDFSPTQQHSDLGLAFFSLATTLFTFTLNLVGTSKALVAVRSAVARVSHRGFRQCQVTPRTSHTTA